MKSVTTTAYCFNMTYYMLKLGQFNSRQNLPTFREWSIFAELQCTTGFPKSFDNWIQMDARSFQGQEQQFPRIYLKAWPL